MGRAGAKETGRGDEITGSASGLAARTSSRCASERYVSTHSRLYAGNGAPEDIAGAAAYLASEEAGYVTGQVISTNGGRYMGSA